MILIIKTQHSPLKIYVENTTIINNSIISYQDLNHILNILNFAIDNEEIISKVKGEGFNVKKI